MKLKITSIFAGLMALTAIATPMIVHAQSPDLSGPIPQQMFSGLNLTEAQKAQLKQIGQSTRSQIQAVLTPQQQEQMKQVRAEGQKMREMVKDLNLTADQKTKIRDIMQASRQQMEAVLTPEQRAQLRQQIQSRIQSRRNQLRPGQ